MYALAANEACKLFGERTTRERNCEATLLVYGLLLDFDDELREGVDELGGGGE